MFLLNSLKRLFYKKNLIGIKLVVLDVDGVLTNGKISICSAGIERKEYNVKDGLGIKLLLASGIQVSILSGGEAGSALLRANKLGIKNYIFNVKDKLKAIKSLQKKLKISKNETLFLGDDINDQIVRPSVNLLIATGDASNSLKEKSNFILKEKGGNGAVRELTEEILKSKKLWKNYKKNGWVDIN